jgi:hypothetical protein
LLVFIVALIFTENKGGCEILNLGTLEGFEEINQVGIKIKGPVEFLRPFFPYLHP